MYVKKCLTTLSVLYTYQNCFWNSPARDQCEREDHISSHEPHYHASKIQVEGFVFLPRNRMMSEQIACNYLQTR